MIHSAPKAKGYVRWFDPSGRTTREADSLQCVHCDLHWIVEPGSGAKRGWCHHCGGPHCGAPGCWTCRPFQQQLDAALARAQLAKAMGLQG